MAEGSQSGPPRLEALAARFGCSTRPVRSALNRLEKEGRLVRKGGKREWTRDREVKKRRNSAPSVHRPVPYKVLRDAAIARSLKGDESYWREEDAADQFLVGRWVVREAFQRLAAEGILSHAPRLGWKVRPFKEADLKDFIETRVALERLALRLAFPTLQRTSLEAFWNGNRVRGTNAGVPDNRLHRYWIEQSGNRYIQQFFAQHSGFFELLFEWESEEPGAARLACRQHRAIIRELMNGNLDQALGNLEVHLRTSHPRIVMPGDGCRGRTSGW